MNTLVVCKPRLPANFKAQKAILESQLQVGDGTELMYLPVFDLVPDESAIQTLRDWISSINGQTPRLVVFVSPSALEIAMQHLGPWPSGLYCGLMGRQSARLAIALGIPKDLILAPSGESDDETEDSQGLLSLVGKHFPHVQCDVAVCKGPRGRIDFPAKLSELGHVVSIIECYDRREINQSVEDCNRLVNLRDKAVLWITSSETALVLDKQLSQTDDPVHRAFKSLCTVLTTHPRITARCRELGYARVVEIPTGIQSVNLWLKTNKTIMSYTNAAPASPSSENPGGAALQTIPQPIVQAPLPTVRTSWLSKLAFFISLVCLVLILLIAFAGKNQIEKTRLAFGERIQKESTTLDLVKEQIGESGDLVKDLKTRFDLLEQAQKEEASQRQSLQEVYNNLLASRTEVSLSEVEQLVSIAKRQLYLLGNVNGAAVALEQAVELLEKADKPSLINLRSALEADLSEIKALPADDLLKLAIDLDSVINSVESLPMLSGADATTQTNLAKLSEGEPADDAGQADSAQSTDEPGKPTKAVGGSFWAHAVAMAQQFAKVAWYDLKSLVEITKVNSPDVLMLSADQQSDIRNALRLSLLNARVTMLSRQGELLKSDLARSEKLIATYFDLQNTQVERAQSVLKQIGAVQVDLTLPELKATTAAFRLAAAGQQGEKR